MTTAKSTALKRVGDLRRMLDARGWSPEELAQHVPVSNMTWRRLLSRQDSDALPAKYQALLARLESPAAADAAASAQDEPALDPVQVVLSGMGQTQAGVLSSMEADGAAVAAPREVLAQSTKRFRDRLVPTHVREMVADLRARWPQLGRAGQALVVGGLAYFLNPFDLIADSVLTVGFIDDLGVLTLIHGRLAGTRGTAATGKEQGSKA